MWRTVPRNKRNNEDHHFHIRIYIHRPLFRVYQVDFRFRLIGLQRLQPLKLVLKSFIGTSSMYMKTW